jgi:hypothetical protein
MRWKLFIIYLVILRLSRKNGLPTRLGMLGERDPGATLLTTFPVRPRDGDREFSRLVDELLEWVCDERLELRELCEECVRELAELELDDECRDLQIKKNI